jgi:transglutaminase superfamily protein
MQSQLARRRRLYLFVFLSFVLAFSSLAVTKALPYASFLIANTDTAVAASDPNHGFSIGSVRWDVEQFSSAPGLAPFRRYFFETCGSQTGTRAAMCLSQAFDRAFPAGIPKHEFLERHFDPVANFEAHLSGQPGHCVNRSGMLATTLLSVGIPARVVSFSPRTGWGGHTLVEVWAGSDWVSVDPTEVGLVGSIRPNSAAEIKRRSGSLRLFKADGSVQQDPYLLSESIARGELVYPEAWLYTRTGPRFSFWPFRGKFIQVGRYSWRFSTPLLLCRVASGISMLAGLCFLPGLLFTRGGIEAANPRLSPKRQLDLAS